MWISCDPGGEHVGLAGWNLSGNAGTCIWTWEATPEEATDLLFEGVSGRSVERLVVESWKLFADKASKMVGSDMPTSKLIGAIEFLVRKFGRGGPGADVDLVFQDPVIKRPTRSLALNRGYRLRSATLDHSGGHASDAELHGLCWLERNGYAWGDWRKENDTGN